MSKTLIYIDGFNFYYGALRGGPYKWLDLERFFVLLRPHDDIQQIHYFTALVEGTAGQRQQEYLRALETRPLINVVLGGYKKKNVRCSVPGCNFAGDRWFKVVEEKRTDVAIAVQILDDAFHDRADHFIVVSGDSDLVPAVDRLKLVFPHKKVTVYVPSRDPRRGAAVELRASADANKTLPLNLLKHSQLPMHLPDGSGSFLQKPSTW